MPEHFPSSQYCIFRGGATGKSKPSGESWTGLAIKKGSPHRFTFNMELANGYGGYLPTLEQHQLGGYETWPARSSFLEVGAEAKIRAEMLRLLSKVKDQTP